MKTYKSYKELKGKTLKCYDRLHFKVNKRIFEYRTMRRCLICLVYFYDVIFDRLNIKDRFEFCSKSYGYKVNHGLFPSCHESDYKALTRVALDLFKLCDNYKDDKKIKINNKKFTSKDIEKNIKIGRAHV